MSIGTFYGIGVGPGDPELLTLKAVRILKAVDRIFCPANGGESWAAQVLAPLDLPAAKACRVELCMNRDRGADRGAYTEAGRQIAGLLAQGQSVAWITEGDPLLYSTFLHVRHEVVRHAPEAPIEIVPGVTSMQAAAACAGMAVAQLDERVAIVPAAYGLAHLHELVERFATVFVLKVHTTMDELLTHLERLPVRATYVERVGTPQERIVTDLSSLRGQRLPYFSLVILQRRGEPL